MMTQEMRRRRLYADTPHHQFGPRGYHKTSMKAWLLKKEEEFTDDQIKEFHKFGDTSRETVLSLTCLVDWRERKENVKTNN